MTILEAYSNLERQFKLPKASLYEILSFITHQNYDWIINHQNEELVDIEQYQNLVTGLQKQIPVAYLLNKKNFFGQEFYVDQRVLIPRGETEIMIEQASLWLVKNSHAQVLDLGTGSGILGLTIKRLFPQTTVYLSDLSPDAIQVSKLNATNQNLEVNYLTGDFLQPILENKLQFDLILCNPPYIDRFDPDLEPSTSFEPSLALFADDNGLMFYHQLFQNLFSLIKNSQNFCLVMEFGWKQKPMLEKMVTNYFDSQLYRVQFQKDYSNSWRCIIISSIY